MAVACGAHAVDDARAAFGVGCGGDVVRRELDARDVAVMADAAGAETRVVHRLLDGKRIGLRRYDRLRFETSTGEIRSLSTDETGEGTALLLRYHGKVQGMTRGPMDHPVTLMPNNLEVVLANVQLSLVWRFLIAVVPAGVTALYFVWPRK